MSEPVAFDANRLPLGPGLRLLEASAGTGKTFALAHLVLRLVAEAGHPLSRLLVVTFTEAATAELRDRIGQRLQAALACLEDGARPPADGVLQTWLEERRAGEEGDLGPLRGRLLLAMEELDAADITTIHGFCRRTLQRQALEAGRSPELQIDSDSETRLAQVVHDTVQQQLLPLPPPLLKGLRAAGVTAEALAAVLRQLEGDPALGLTPPPALTAWSEPLPRWLPGLVEERWRRFQALWRRDGRELETDLRVAAQRWREDYGASKTGDYSPRPRRDRCEDLQAWIDSQPAAGDYGAIRRQPLLSHYHPGTFSKVAREHERPADGQVRLPRPDLMEAIAALVDGPAELALLHAAHGGRRELQQRREKSGVTTFSQLLADLDPGPGGNGAGALLEAVGERYAAALVDEFQDTDPIQWRILQRAFGGGRHPLLIVGDPKQAIYRFRGGDLPTYLRARGQAESVLALQENRRSTAALIDGLNGLMEPGLPLSGLAVPPVLARAERGEPLPPQPPIELLWLGERGEPIPAKTALEAWWPPRIAGVVVELLERGLELAAPGGGRRPLGPEDLCLLVNQHRQAEAVRAALERRGVPSRLVSRADVFASPAATALQRLLDALADPADANRVRLLAVSPLLGWDAERLRHDAHQEGGRLAGRLALLAEQLPQRGLLGVLADLIDGERMASLALSGRLLADLQQVAGLVQERVHADQLGAEAAADWLRRLRLTPERIVPEEHQAHSDRVDGAVSVVTIHRSKGLEYPVVICPVLWSGAGGSRGGGSRTPGRRWLPPGAEAPHLDLHLDPRWGPGWAAQRQQQRAEEAERERLAYVAATRARDLLLLAWGPARGQQGGPLFPWLFREDPVPDPDEDTMAALPPETWRQRLEEQIACRGLPMVVRDAPAAEGPRWRPPPPEGGVPLACGPVPLPQAIDRLWGRSSYSSWTAAAHGGAPGGAPGGAAIPDEGRDILDPEPSEDPSATDGGDGEGDGPLAPFPRGAAAGDCLHRILERLALADPLASAANQAVVERELRRAGLDPSWQEAVSAGLERMRLTPFGGPLGPLRPADLAPDHRQAEMGFDLRIDTVRAADLARPFHNHPEGAFGQAYAERLAALPVASRGFLTGSIDLVFHAPAAADGGRWWVLDWKSNWLGERDGAGQPRACGPRHYGPEAMALLMADRHYPLQAHLYLVALHRLLAWRLPDYDPERHLGGYAYVFLRGTPGPQAGGRGPEQALAPGTRVPGMMVERPPLARLLALDAVLGGRTEAPW
jgi:exodeoxyribonuclease V beta subunit